MFSYFRWWTRYRLSLFRPFRGWWLKERWYDLKNLIHFLKHGITERDTWNIYSMLTTKFLKASHWLAQPGNGHGYPAGLEGSQTVASIDPTAYDNDATPSPEFLQWKEILHKMRFAHFYIQFIEEDEFSWMINSRKDRKNCYKWARKHYKYLSDFLTWRFFLQMYTNESFKYTTKMLFIEEPGKDYGEIKFEDSLTATGEVVDLPIGIKYPHVEIAKKQFPEYEEGMELFKKYYKSLWD
jgi:hypothetical protein